MSAHIGGPSKPRKIRTALSRLICAASAILLLWGGLITSTPAMAQSTEVDLELVLLVDVSRSMTEDELELQRRGYAEALQSDAVFKALQSGMLQRLALTYVEWAGTQEVIVDWHLITSRDDLRAFARQLTVQFNPALRRTSISGALDYATTLIDQNAFTGLRRVIDISGDGPNNLGRRVTAARDQAVARGITINGLPLMTDEGSPTFFHLDQLDVYYQTCVIGGTGAFVIPVRDWPDFATAVRQKLVLEIAGLAETPQIIQAQQFVKDPTDCHVGEKIWLEWQRSGRTFFFP